MPYLNLDLDYFTHPKTTRLKGLLGKGAAELPIRLWAYCGKYHSETGTLDGYSPAEIESIVNWQGETGKMVDAMVQVNFLEKNANGYTIHDWKEHAGHLAAFKKRAKSAAYKRWKSYATSNASSNRKHKITNAPNLSSPYLTLPYQDIKHSCPQELFDLWNEACKNGNMISARELSKSRIEKCKIRLKERTMEEWGKIFNLCTKSPFLNGNGKNGWKASFDWVISNADNAVKILEGKYNQKEKEAEDKTDHQKELDRGLIL